MQRQKDHRSRENQMNRADAGEKVEQEHEGEEAEPERGRRKDWSATESTQNLHRPGQMKPESLNLNSDGKHQGLRLG